MPVPYITITDEKCPDPMGCRKCLLICPTRSLGLGTNVGPRKFQEIDASHFIVRPVRLQACTVCNKCVDVCPNGAIRVSLDEGAVV